MSLKTPKVPDASEGLAAGKQTANEQQGYNASAQAASLVNQENPYGSVSYNQTGVGPNGVPTYTADVSLSPENQQLFDTLMGTKSTAGGAAQGLLAGANYGAQSPGDVIGGMTSGTTKDLLDKETSYLQPFFQTSKDQLDTRLRNQGLLPGQPAYDNAMRGLDTNQGLTVSNFLANAEPQAFQQATTTYGLPMQMATALAGFGAPSQPNEDFLSNIPGMQPANLVGATANANEMAMNAYNAKNQQYMGTMAGLFGIPTALLGSWGKAGMPLPIPA